MVPVWLQVAAWLIVTGLIALSLYTLLHALADARARRRLRRRMRERRERVARDAHQRELDGLANAADAAVQAALRSTDRMDAAIDRARDHIDGTHREPNR